MCHVCALVISFLDLLWCHGFFVSYIILDAVCSRRSKTMRCWWMPQKFPCRSHLPTNIEEKNKCSPSLLSHAPSFSKRRFLTPNMLNYNMGCCVMYVAYLYHFEKIKQASGNRFSHRAFSKPILPPAAPARPAASCSEPQPVERPLGPRGPSSAIGTPCCGLLEFGVLVMTSGNLVSWKKLEVICFFGFLWFPVNRTKCTS